MFARHPQGPTVRDLSCPDAARWRDEQAVCLQQQQQSAANCRWILKRYPRVSPYRTLKIAGFIAQTAASADRALWDRVTSMNLCLDETAEGRWTIVPKNLPFILFCWRHGWLILPEINDRLFSVGQIIGHERWPEPWKSSRKSISQHIRPAFSINDTLQILDIHGSNWQCSCNYSHFHESHTAGVSYQSQANISIAYSLCVLAYLNVNTAH